MKDILNLSGNVSSDSSSVEQELHIKCKKLQDKLRPLDKELDLYSAKIAEINFRFSDIESLKDLNSSKLIASGFLSPKYDWICF